jgi:arginine N-succinyltransferase
MSDWLIQSTPLEPGAQAAEGWHFSACHGSAPELPVAEITLRLGTGLAQPRHWYHLGTVVHAAPDLQLFHRQSTLLMGSDLTGAAELCHWACIAPGLDEATQASAFRALVGAALDTLAAPGTPGIPGVLAAAAASARSPLRVFAELPGLRDAQGQSPFWQGLGQHFFPYTLAQAERRFGAGWVHEVAALMPRHPLLVSFLPESAQAALSAVPASQEAFAWALADAGLAPGQHVGLVDGGAVFEASVTRRRAP